MIIGFVGKMGSGKTTISLALQKCFVNESAIVVNFADSLKEMISNHLGIPLAYFYDQEKKNTILKNLGFAFDDSETIGTLMQKWGATLRTIHPDIFVMAMKKHIEPTKRKIVIVGDVRYQNEYHWIRQQKNGVLIRLTGDPSGCRENTSRNREHESETQLDSLGSPDFFATIENDGSKTPEAIAADLYEKLSALK